jgi:beta-glucosidase
LGYLYGNHAPGHQSLDEMLAASHHLLLAHGLAVPVIRTNVADAEVGIVLNLTTQVAASRSAADRAAAYHFDGTVNRWYLDPLNGRGYPCDAVAHYNRPMDFVQPGDLDVIALPIDFWASTITSATCGACTVVPEEMNLPQELFRGEEITEMGWEVYPQGLYDTLARVYFDYRYPKALYVTENGAAFPDTLGTNGRVEDPQRVAYYREHLKAAAHAIQAGIPLKAIRVVADG